MCLEHGIVTAATVTDHVEPHRGNYNKFWLGALQSLCFSCHDKLKRQQEIKGFHNAVGLDGFPTDSRSGNSEISTREEATMADEEQQEQQPVLTTKQIKEQFDAGSIDDDTAMQLLQSYINAYYWAWDAETIVAWQPVPHGVLQRAALAIVQHLMC